MKRKISIVLGLALVLAMVTACAHNQAMNTAKVFDNGFYQALKVTEAKIPELAQLAKTNPTAKKLLPQVVKSYQLAIDANLELNAAIKIWQQTGKKPADIPELVTKVFTLLGQIADTAQKAGVNMKPLTDQLGKLVKLGGAK